jgi:SH3-like domain-containing protein
LTLIKSLIFVVMPNISKQKMKILSLKTNFLLILILFLGMISFAQSQSDRTFTLKLQDELDLFEPDTLLGDKIWGLAALSVSNIRANPKHTSELVSQVTMGTPVKLIEETEGWLRVQTPDGYNGWMDTSGLKRVTSEGIELWKYLNRFVFNCFSGYAYDAPSSKGQIVTDLVLGDIIVAEDTKKGFLKVRLPDGRLGYVKKKECILWSDWINKTPDVQQIMSVARQMMGSPYLWGGTSVKATDCSGLVKIAYFSQAIILERDASQQARNGEPVDFTNFENLQPGDLLFFGSSDQNIVHIGIYLGKGYYIHDSGFVQINSIDPGNPKYNIKEKKKLLVARRILNSLNTQGIVRVKDHPWYNP